MDNNNSDIFRRCESLFLSYFLGGRKLQMNVLVSVKHTLRSKELFQFLIHGHSRQHLSFLCIHL